MMRRPVASTVRTQIARTAIATAPVGGWNARDGIAAMGPQDAVILQNWFPTTSGVKLRNGSTNWATGLGNQVNSLMGYNPASGAFKLFAAAGGAVFDVTSGGAVGAAAISGLSSDKWIHTNFATPAGPFLCMVNGIDAYHVYDGSAWTTPSITGVASSDLTFVIPFANRLWFIEKESLNAWYLPVSSIAGAASQFPMQAIFRRGGSLVALGVWTVDGGDGMQDYLLFVTSEGEIAVYGGTDPSQASTFSLVGVYQLGTPMGSRCFLKYGGDVLYVGKDGLGAISDFLASTRINTEKTLTYKIQGAISQATMSYASNFGWQMILHPIQNALMLNVPVADGQQQQYVMNTITGAWCNFTDWAANCWERLDDELYYGGNGVVVKAWTNNFDDNGSQINAEALSAFQNFGTNQLKQFTMARPILQSTGVPGVLIGLNTDFDTVAPVGLPSFTQPTYGLWDSGLWDTAIWGTSFQLSKDWEYVSGLGTWAAMHVKTSALDSSVLWTATSYLMQDGGVL